MQSSLALMKQFCMETSEHRTSLWRGPALITGLLLVLPLLGNHFVKGWNWNAGAFVILGALLFSICFTYELIARNRRSLAYRAAVAIAFAAGFGLTWGSFVQMADVTLFAATYF